MKRALIFIAALAAASPAIAQAPGETAGPTTNQTERDAIAARVRAGADCTACDLFQIDLAYRNVSGRDFSRSRIRQANLSLAIADRANFSGANLSIANLFGARLTGANLANTNLTQATLVGAYLGGARFEGAVLTGANLSGAELETARGLTQAQLNAACGDATTRLPAGMTVPTC